MEYIIIHSTKYSEDVLVVAACGHYKEIEISNKGLSVSINDIEECYVFEKDDIFNNMKQSSLVLSVNVKDEMFEFDTRYEMFEEYYNIIIKEFFKNKNKAVIKAIFSIFKDKDINILNYILSNKDND